MDHELNTTMASHLRVLLHRGSVATACCSEVSASSALSTASQCCSLSTVLSMLGVLGHSASVAGPVTSVVNEHVDVA